MAEQARWYVIHTYSGYENKVAKSIDTVVGLRGMQDPIIEVKVPTEIVRDVKESGEVTENERKLFPGYVLVQMVMNDDTWVLIKNIRGVTGFVGPEGKPVALTEDEVKALDLVKSVAESPCNQRTDGQFYRHCGKCRYEFGQGQSRYFDGRTRCPRRSER